MNWLVYVLVKSLLVGAGAWLTLVAPQPALLAAIALFVVFAMASPDWILRRIALHCVSAIVAAGALPE